MKNSGIHLFLFRRYGTFGEITFKFTTKKEKKKEEKVERKTFLAAHDKRNQVKKEKFVETYIREGVFI